jgi:hypothetical protein
VDIGNIVYIVAVLAYFIYRGIQGSKQKDLAEPNKPDSAEDRPVSFEDLLKEIRQAQTPAKPKPELKPVAREIIDPREKLRAKPIVVRRSEVAEEMDSEARFYEGSYNTATQNATKISDISYEGSFLKVDPQEISKKVNPYAQILKNPRSFREALILSEIIKPKHF